MGLRWFVPLAALMALLLASCGDDGGTAQDVDATATECAGDEGAGPFFLYEDSEWEFREGIEYAAGAGRLEEVEPGLEWFVDYERNGVRVRLSGHDVGLDTQLEELPGFEPDDAEIAGRRAYTSAGTEVEPAVVGLDVDEYTVMLLSYDTDLDELVEIAASLERVCQQEWVEAGGEILDCDPFEPGCKRQSSTTSATTSTTPTTITTTTGP